MVQSSKHIEKIFEQKKDFVIIATTGKVNSKVTDVCKLLTSENLLPDTATQPADTSGYDMSEIREFKVVYRYLHHNWRPFIEISVTSIMISFLLESNIAELENQLAVESEGKTTYDLLKDALEPNIKNRVKKRLEKIQGILKNDTNKEELEEKVEHLVRTIYEEDDIVSGLKKLNTRYIKDIEKDLMESICFFYGILPEINDYLERTLKDTGIYTRLFQDYGNNIRAFGKAICGSNDKINAENIFVMPERVNRVLKLLRHHGKSLDKRKRSNPVFVVINNFKNIFEAFYFRCRYSSFYLLSVACDEDERRQCFDTSTEYHLTDLKENLSLGKKVFRRFDRIIDEKDNFRKMNRARDFKAKYKTNISEAEFLFLKQIYQKGSGPLTNYLIL